MGFVVEITSRAGRVLNFYKFDKTECLIGRGYHCDVILDDPYVDGEHLAIGNSLEGLRLSVRSETAFTQVDKADLGVRELPIASGTRVEIGKTHLRILATSHAVEPARALQQVDRVLTRLGQPLVVVGLTLMFLLLAVVDEYFGTINEIQLSRFTMQIISPLTVAFVWVAFCALVTRISRGESRLTQHWVVVLFVLAFMLLFGYLEEWLQFNIGDHGMLTFLSYAVTGLALVVLFWLQLRIAFRQSAALRMGIANVLGWGVVAYGFLTATSFERDFRGYPEFESGLMPQAMLFRRPRSEDEFLDQARTLFVFPAIEEEGQNP